MDQWLMSKNKTCFISTSAVAPARPHPPALHRHPGPHRLDHAKRPRALEEAIGRRQPAGRGEGEDECRAARLERVEHEHRGHGDEAEERESVHCLPYPSKARWA